MVEHISEGSDLQRIVDSDARSSAIDTQKSCCVTAPAGSGKTELLTQRYLGLLAQVDSPEQLLALTFTRKAAAEMRERIINALQNAADGTKASSPHQLQTFELAEAALAQSQRLEWNLLQYPLRLKIQTIDSLCHTIVRDQPLFSGAGGQLQALDNARPLYLMAINSYLDELGRNPKASEVLETLLLYCDNNLEQLKQLLLEMLPIRDQWLGHASTFNAETDRVPVLDKMLQKRVEQALELAQNALKPYSLAIVNAARFAAENFASGLCEASSKAQGITELENLEILPAPTQSSFLQWQGIAELLLKDDLQPRKALNKNQGFPAQSVFKTPEEKEAAKAIKAQLLEVCEALGTDSHALDALQTLALLPLAGYEEEQLKLLDAMVQALIRLAAHLSIVFHQRGECDHLEITSSALQALNGQSAYPELDVDCLLYTSPSPRDREKSRMPSSA